jgi:hypothetical protein
VQTRRRGRGVRRLEQRSTLLRACWRHASDTRHSLHQIANNKHANGDNKQAKSNRISSESAQDVMQARLIG